MNRLLALAAAIALVAACVAPPEADDNDAPEFSRPGAENAAAMGYHGPVHRAPKQQGN